mmetsp:Transcript_13886/g.23014  ORF Transcript_13886/g.23014 Transcript_13886/m.23014 type:complete len:428 (+) Transcript_13886:198-1481(+)|eukprot:CAMPEP_0119027288 /NCGR_PEP_ID=MMETSP1176-20130426/36846_1 /TAXON_ID=265551 /ORGANISM="Synedropsis recta cf, Strain CCMP1620" /LENGTH=427 /DNA_ID=CAMNT_0006983177 /DNA_START=110 /DNA_END=1393 /DNA_ORIENTATION=+
MKNEVGQACMFLLVFGLLFLASAPSSLYLGRRKSTLVRKTRTKKQTKHTEVFEKISDRCEVPDLHEPADNKIGAAFLASYPGSDTQLQWELVEAVTGVVTTDDTFANGHHNVVAIKTHYPCPAGRAFPGAEEIFKAIIFIRHPMDALPAYHDIIYASEKGLPIDPPAHAPLDEWINWRDLAFARELETWRKHFTYWMDRHSSLNRLVVPYEQLTSRKYGPDLVIEMADFLKQGNNAITTVEPEILPCIWQKIMNKVHPGDGNNNNKNKLRRRLQQDLSLQQQQGMSGGHQGTVQQISATQMLGTNQLNPGGYPDEPRSLSGISLQAEATLLIKEQTQVVPSNAIQMIDMHQLNAATPEEPPPIRQQAPVLEDDRDAQRPYTEHQRKEIVIALTQLLEVYRDERVLAPMLVGYVDQVAKLHEEEERQR